jgi:hypothetical protein
MTPIPEIELTAISSGWATKASKIQTIVSICTFSRRKSSTNLEAVLDHSERNYVALGNGEIKKLGQKEFLGETSTA